MFLFSELSLGLVVDSSEEDVETTAVQERTVQWDPGSQVHHHSHSTHSRPHWCFLWIWLLYSQSKWKLRWSNKMTFLVELSVWPQCPTPFRHQEKTSTPSWGWIWRGPCCFSYHAKTQSCTPTTPSGERRFMKNTRSVRCVLVLCSDLQWHSVQLVQKSWKSCFLFCLLLAEQQFEIPEEEVEWLGLSLEEAVEKQRQLEHKVKKVFKHNCLNLSGSFFSLFTAAQLETSQLTRQFVL